jgi:acyl carrier protein
VEQRSPTAAAVLAILCRHVAAGGTVTEDATFFNAGVGLDSIGFLSVVLEIEEAVGIRLGEEDLTEEVLATVGSFVAHVERRRASVRP